MIIEATGPTMDPNENELRRRYNVPPAGSPRIAKRHRLVLAALRSASEQQGGTACMSVPSLAKRTGLSLAAAGFARNDLRRWGLIECVERGGGAVPPTWRVVQPETDVEFMRRAGVVMSG